MKQFKYKIIAFALSIVTVFAPFININSYAGGGASISFETQVDENGNEYVVDGEGHRHYLEEGRGYDQWSNADKRSFWIKVISQFLVQKKGVITDNESLWKFLGDTYYIGYELNNHTYEEMFLDVFRNIAVFYRRV